MWQMLATWSKITYRMCRSHCMTHAVNHIWRATIYAYLYYRSSTQAACQAMSVICQIAYCTKTVKLYGSRWTRGLVYCRIKWGRDLQWQPTGERWMRLNFKFYRHSYWLFKFYSACKLLLILIVAYRPESKTHAAWSRIAKRQRGTASSCAHFVCAVLTSRVGKYHDIFENIKICLLYTSPSPRD